VLTVTATSDALWRYISLSGALRNGEIAKEKIKK
jgi:hypothetical protein